MDQSALASLRLKSLPPETTPGAAATKTALEEGEGGLARLCFDRQFQD